MKPHAGFPCTVTRPDGATYEAFMLRYDGPEGDLAVVYVEPADCPHDMKPYEQVLDIGRVTPGPQYALGWSDAQHQRVVEFAEQVLGVPHG